MGSDAMDHASMGSGTTIPSRDGPVKVRRLDPEAVGWSSTVSTSFAASDMLGAGSDFSSFTASGFVAGCSEGGAGAASVITAGGSKGGADDGAEDGTSCEVCDACNDNPSVSASWVGAEICVFSADPLGIDPFTTCSLRVGGT